MGDNVSSVVLDLLKDLSENERFLFQSEYAEVRKSVGTGIVFSLFLGGFGAEYFYLGYKMRGILCVLFCWTLIPTLVALFECFRMGKHVGEYNRRKAAEIVVRLRGMRKLP